MSFLLDEILKMSLAVPGVYGVLAPYGGGKTLLACKLAVDAARMLEQMPECPQSVVISSSSPRYVRLRLLAYAAQVKYSCLCKASEFHERLTEGEWKRVQEAGCWLQTHVQVLDSSLNTALQADPYQDLSEKVGRYCDFSRQERKLGLLIVDDANDLWSAARSNACLDASRYHTQASIVQEQIAAFYGCGVWTMQTPVFRTGKDNAQAEILKEAERMVAAFVLRDMEPLDAENTVATLFCAKSRHTLTSDQQPRVLIQGDAGNVFPRAESPVALA